MRRIAVVAWLLCAMACNHARLEPAAGKSWCSPRGRLTFARHAIAARAPRLGVLADAGAPEATASLQRLVAELGARKVDAIVALGNLGATQADLARVLVTLGGLRVPVFALAGVDEPRDAWSAALAQARSGGADVIDLVATPLVDAGAFDLVAVAGAPDAANGCTRDADDVAALTRAAGRRWRPLLIASYLAPRSDGTHAVDWSGEKNGGDPLVRGLVDALYPNAALVAAPEAAGGAVERGWINAGSVRAEMAIVVELNDGVAQRQLVR